jgi:hypothetical protein
MFMSDEGLVVKAYNAHEEREQAIKALQDVLSTLPTDGQAQLKSVLAYLEK